MSRLPDAASDAPDLFSLPPLPPDPLEGIPDEVRRLFESLALRIAEQGFTRYSARAVLHRIRWHMHVDKGDREFKANNNWTPALARWFLKRHPELGDFFETRRSPGSDDETA